MPIEVRTPGSGFLMGARVVAIIPARYESTRFPGKALAAIAGKPMIQHVYERTARASAIERVIVATDDARIHAAAEKFGAEVVLTKAAHVSGTDRVAEVAAAVDTAIVVNVQGDLPLVSPELLRAPLAAMDDEPGVPMATLKAPIRDAAELQSSHVVKVVTDAAGNALYFSRCPIPFCRDATPTPPVAYRHIGVYVYRRDFLLRFAGWAPTPLEKAEKLEQLRALERGFRIKVAAVERAPIAVDTPGDLERARAIAAGEGREDGAAQ